MPSGIHTSRRGPRSNADKISELLEEVEKVGISSCRFKHGYFMFVGEDAPRLADFCPNPTCRAPIEGVRYTIAPEPPELTRARLELARYHFLRNEDEAGRPLLREASAPPTGSQTAL